MIITAAHVIRAMIPAMRERGKKMAAIHGTKNETQPAASMVSFRIVIEGRERNRDLSPVISFPRHFPFNKPSKNLQHSVNF